MKANNMPTKTRVSYRFTSNKIDIGMEKNRNKNWDGGYLFYPFLHPLYTVYAYNKYKLVKIFYSKCRDGKKNRNKNWD